MKEHRTLGVKDRSRDRSQRLGSGRSVLLCTNDLSEELKAF